MAPIQHSIQIESYSKNEDISLYYDDIQLKGEAAKINSKNFLLTMIYPFDGIETKPDTKLFLLNYSYNSFSFIIKGRLSFRFYEMAYQELIDIYEKGMYFFGNKQEILAAYRNLKFESIVLEKEKIELIVAFKKSKRKIKNKVNEGKISQRNYLEFLIEERIKINQIENKIRDREIEAEREIFGNQLSFSDIDKFMRFVDR